MTSPSDRFDLYLRMVAAPRDGLVYWWYFGTTTVEKPGLPPIPVLNAATLMVYRVETLAPERVAIHWDEVGCFRDYVTGQPVPDWLNPLTGRRMRAPQQFAEGPARYEVTPSPEGVAIELLQPGANVLSVKAGWSTQGDRACLTQVERKWRGYPDANGRLPPPDSGAGFEAVTELVFLDRPDADGSATEGLYTFALAGTPPWMGFEPDAQARTVTRGLIRKAAPGAPPDPVVDARLRAAFPAFFEKYRA